MRRISKLLMISLAVCTFVASQALAAGSTVSAVPQQPQGEHSVAMPSQGAGETTSGTVNGRVGSTANSDRLFHPMVYQRASQLLGKTVVDRNNRKVGSIKDLIFNKYGHIDYVILARGGLLGVDATPVPIPWSQVVSEGALAARGYVTLNMSKAKLENAPTMAKAKGWIALHEPDMGTADFFHKVNSYFGGPGISKGAMG